MLSDSEWVLAWASMAVGLVGVASAAVSVPASERPPAPPVLRLLLPLAGAGLILAFLAYLSTRGVDPPFFPDQRLGTGFLLGAGAGLLYVAAAAIGRCGESNLATGGMGAAVAAVSAALLLFRDYPQPALAGVPFGLGAALLWLDRPSPDRELEGPNNPQPAISDPQSESLPRAIRLGGNVGFLTAAILSLAAILAIARYEELHRVDRLAAGEKLWWVMPAAVGAAVVLGQLGSRLLRGRSAASALLAGTIAFALLAALLALVKGRGAAAVPPSAWTTYGWLFLPLAAGWITALLLGAISGVAQAFQPGESAHPESAGWKACATSPPTAVLGTLLLLALLAAAYRCPWRGQAADPLQPTLAGYGIGLAGLGFLLAAPWFLGADGRGDGVPARVFLYSLAALATAAAFRVFYERYDLDDSGIRLAAHYVLIGLFAGVLAPFGFAAVAGALDGEDGRRTADDGRRTIPLPDSPISQIPASVRRPSSSVPFRSLIRGALLAILAALLPALLVLFWGIRAGGALLLGLTAGFGFMLLLTLLEPSPEEGRAGRLAAALPVIPVLLAALVTLNALGPLDFYATHWPRSLRIILTVLLAMLFPIWVFRCSGVQAFGRSGEARSSGS